jgi:hypothetical protein
MHSPALRLAEAVDDDATELTRTDMQVGIEADDAPTCVRAPYQPEGDRTQPVVSVVILDEDEEEAAAPRPASPDAQELRLLRDEALRLQRALDTLRAERDQGLQELLASNTEAREALQEAADWQAVARRAEARIRALEHELGHYQAFARASAWARLRGCPPCPPLPEG